MILLAMMGSVFRLRFHGSMYVCWHKRYRFSISTREKAPIFAGCFKVLPHSDDSHDSPIANENERFEQANSSYSHIERRS